MNLGSNVKITKKINGMYDIMEVTDAGSHRSHVYPWDLDVRHSAKKLLAWNEQYDDGDGKEKGEVVAIIHFVMSTMFELCPHICSKFCSIFYTCQWDAISFVRMWPKCCVTWFLLQSQGHDFSMFNSFKVEVPSFFTKSLINVSVELSLGNS